MDGGLPSINSVRDALNLPQTTDFSSLTDVRGLSPNEIMGHAKAREYTILGITPNQFMQEHGGDLFDYDQLKKNFKQICEDFGNELTMDEKSQAVQFCSKMIYTVGPESRSVKQKMGDKTWVFKFPYSIEGKLVVKAAFVCTFKNEGAKYDLNANNSNRMVLSVRHASLLTIETMNQITDICVRQNPPTVMLTPLCCAIFSRTDIMKMVEVLSLTLPVVVRMLNSSCQSGGHYLNDSELAVAALASIVATSKLGAKGKHDERTQIITKVIKQYLNHQKAYEPSVFTALSRFATGGVPTDLEPNKLIKIYTVNKELVKVSKLSAIAASRLTRVNVEGSRLAGRINDDEGGSYEDEGEQSSTMRSMHGVNIRSEQEDMIVRKAVAESNVLKRYRPDPKMRTLILTADFRKLLDNFRVTNELSGKVPYSVLEKLYDQMHSKDPEYVLARDEQKAIERKCQSLSQKKKKRMMKIIRIKAVQCMLVPLITVRLT